MKLILAAPINGQLGLAQVLSKFDDDQILEVTDCDMLHFRPCPVTYVGPDELLTANAATGIGAVATSASLALTRPVMVDMWRAASAATRASLLGKYW